MTVTASFGAGGTEPYARALREPEALFLNDEDNNRGALMDVARWNSSADLIDLTLLTSVTGPMLDIGCGPGRMVRAAMDMGISALGLDVSAAAIASARTLGINVREGSVFDAVPMEGQWQTALLVDGNIGIGGDVAALVARCASVVAPGGEIVIEVHADPDRHHTYTATLVDGHGGASASFPWAEIGVERLTDLAGEQGLVVRQSWELGGRSFARLATRR